MHGNVSLNACVCMERDISMSIGWEPDMIGWACVEPFSTLATVATIPILKELPYAECLSSLNLPSLHCS